MFSITKESLHFHSPSGLMHCYSNTVEGSTGTCMTVCIGSCVHLPLMPPITVVMCNHRTVGSNFTPLWLGVWSEGVALGVA